MIAPKTKQRVLLPLVVLGLLIGLGTTPSNAGHRSRFAFSVGLYHPYNHFGLRSYYWPGRYMGPRLYSVPHGGYGPAVYPGTNVGAISLKVKPKKTEIYVDGQPIGRAGKYDGYPGYLWLEKGAHELVFFKEGFRTFGRTFEVRGGMITEVVVQMEAGEAAAPETVMAPGTDRSERQAARLPKKSNPRAPVAAPDRAAGGKVLDLRSAWGRIRVVVEPGDASIYLDGRFIGTGAEMLRLRGGLMLDEGEHHLEAVHPRYLSDRLSFRVKAGEDLEVRLTLDQANGS